MHGFWLYNHDLKEADFIIIIPYRYLFAFRFSIAYANNFSILTQLKSMYIAFFFHHHRAHSLFPISISFPGPLSLF